MEELLEETGIEALIADVERNPRIRIHLSATTGEIAGAPGLFDVTHMGVFDFRGPNACAFLPSGTPPEDLAALVDHYGLAS